MKPASSEKTDIVDNSKGTQEEPSRKTDIVIKALTEMEKPIQDEASADSVHAEVSKETNIALDSNLTIEKPSEMTDSVENSKVHVQDSEIMESAPSPVSVQNTDFEGHTESLDEDEAIKNCI